MLPKILPLFLVFVFISCDGQYPVKGKVLNTNGEPVPDAKVEFFNSESGQDHSGKTNKKGEFNLTYISGFHKFHEGVLLVSKDNYKTKSTPFTAGKDEEVEIILEENEEEIN